MIRENHILFFTATIVNWKHLLKPDKYKQVIVNSLQFLVENKRIYLYAFVIMPNHIHILWRIREPHQISEVKRDFLKFVSQSIKQDLQKYHPKVLEIFKSKRKDRKYQFWQDRSYNIPLYNRKVVEQKLRYIHNNPLSKKWHLVSQAEDYKFSSAKFYLQENNDWEFLTNYCEHV